jgi:hypothetical protein
VARFSDESHDFPTAVWHAARVAARFQARIAAGLADPISDLERHQLEEMRRIYVRRFGKEPT